MKVVQIGVIWYGKHRKLTESHLFVENLSQDKTTDTQCEMG